MKIYVPPSLRLRRRHFVARKAISFPVSTRAANAVHLFNLRLRPPRIRSSLMPVPVTINGFINCTGNCSVSPNTVFCSLASEARAILSVGGVTLQVGKVSFEEHGKRRNKEATTSRRSERFVSRYLSRTYTRCVYVREPQIASSAKFRNKPERIVYVRHIHCVDSTRRSAYFSTHLYLFEKKIRLE